MATNNKNEGERSKKRKFVLAFIVDVRRCFNKSNWWYHGTRAIVIFCGKQHCKWSHSNAGCQSMSINISNEYQMLNASIRIDFLTLFSLFDQSLSRQRSIETWFKYFVIWFHLFHRQRCAVHSTSLSIVDWVFFSCSLQSIHCVWHVRQKAAQIFEYLIPINHAYLIANNRKEYYAIFFFLSFCRVFFFLSFFVYFKHGKSFPWLRYCFSIVRSSHVINAKLSMRIDISISMQDPSNIRHRLPNLFIEFHKFCQCPLVKRIVVLVIQAFEYG